ncbi:MAG: insulinase family protein [Rhizobiales bacterium]|nr:insulinase family protein [Hyphomicrobiales bacterium]
MTHTKNRTRVSAVKTDAGFEIWHVEDYTVPVVSLEFAFQGGAAQDPGDRAGLASLMASLLDEGAGNLTSDAFQEALEEKAIELSFDVSRDRLSGSLRTLSEHADSAFELLALAIREPRFDADAIDRVRAQMISGLKRDETDPGALTRNALYRIAFAGHPYSQPVDGRIADLQNIRRDDVAAMKKRLMGRSNLILVAVGAISADALAKGIDHAFSGLQAQPDLVSLVPTGMDGAGHVEIIDLDIPQSTLYLAMPGLGRKHPDFMAAHVVNHILGGGSFTSRMWQEVREKRGLAYSVWSTLRWSAFADLFMAGTATSNERVAESLAVMREEIAKMAESGPTDEELEKAKAYLTGSYALQFDTSRKIADHLLMLRADGMPIDYIDRRNDEILAVTAEKARAVAARLFGSARPLVIATGRPQGLA